MIAISVFARIMLRMAQQAKALHLKIVPGGEKEAFACERVTVESVLSRKTKIAIIIGWIITGIAIAFVWICATGSHGLKTLISASMGVVFVAVFIVLAITAIGGSEEEEVERVV